MITVPMRASSVASFFDCNLRWAAIHLDKIRNLPSTPPAAIGTACHAGTAAFDSARMAGSPITADDAAEALMESLHHPEQEVDWAGMPMRDAERRALGVHTKYCADIAQGFEFVAVEHRLAPLQIAFDEHDITIELTGTLDRIYTRDQRHGVADVKTGERACSQKPSKHKAQGGVYELLAENDPDIGLKIDLPTTIIQLQTSNEYKAGTAEIEHPRLALLGTDEQPGLLEHAARMFKTGDFFGNSSSWLCSEKLCPIHERCIFR